MSPQSPLQEPHEEEQAPSNGAGLGPLGKTSRGAASIAAGTVRPWGRDPSGAGMVPGDGGTSLPAPIPTPLGTGGSRAGVTPPEQRSRPASELRNELFRWH